MSPCEGISLTMRLARIACVLALVAPPASAQVPLPANSEVEVLIQHLVDSHGVSGIVVGLLGEDGTRRVIAHGDPGAGARPLDADSVFEIGSMTKVFTGILLADQVRRGEVELADALADLMPTHVSVPARSGKPITLLDLTTHFSGLPMMPTNLAPADPANPFAEYTTTRMYEFISNYELPRDPGDAFEYSNIGMALLGQVLALRAGAPTYEALVTERILRPLGMTRTAVVFTPWMKDRLVRGHNRAGDPVVNWDMIETAGMGGLRSTMNDMLTFAAANLSAADRSSEATGLAAAIRASHRGLRQTGEDFAHPGIPTAFRQGRVAFNWFISRPGARRITWTVGLTGGYSSFVGLDFEAGRAVVVLTNTGLNNVDYLGFHLLDPTVPAPTTRGSAAVRYPTDRGATSGARPDDADSASCLEPTTLSARLEFASAERGGEILGRADRWARQLSAFDRAARQRTLEPTTTEELLAFVSGHARSWTSEERAYWSRLVDRLSEAAAGLMLSVPEIFLVKTTGMEEFGFAYARDRAIVLPQGRLEIAGDERRDFFLLAHEFFHYLSVNNPALRDSLYELLGFRQRDGFTYPPELEDRRVSNPAWYADHVSVPVDTPRGLAEVVPLIRTSIPLEQVIRLPTGGRPAITRHIEHVLVAVDPQTGRVLRDAAGAPITYPLDDTDLADRMARNTSYMFHPQEVIADNFALLMEWRATAVQPDVVPGGPGEGFRVNDVPLLQAIERVLTHGCPAPGGITAVPQENSAPAGFEYLEQHPAR
jgi:serine-type D-Ala-D-Ala carboxypeptidase/endopeptidase